MNRHSTLVSYLHRLVWLLTGNFGKPGTHYSPTGLVEFASGANGKLSPVAEAPLISGLVPCNVIAEEIVTDHPDRYRAMIVEATNPAHSLADSQKFREAMHALDTLVVIDVALTETAKLADYVLPASTQFEKAEATFFNFEFPHNYFHLRHRLFDEPSSTVSSPEASSPPPQAPTVAAAKPSSAARPTLRQLRGALSGTKATASPQNGQWVSSGRTCRLQS